MSCRESSNTVSIGDLASGATVATAPSTLCHLKRFKGIRSFGVKCPKAPLIPLFFRERSDVKAWFGSVVWGNGSVLFGNGSVLFGNGKVQYCVAASRNGKVE